MTAQAHTADYSGDAYRACLAGAADENQQQSAASQIILLHAIKGELVALLREAGEEIQPFNRMADLYDRIETLLAKASGEAGQ